MPERDDSSLAEMRSLDVGSLTPGSLLEREDGQRIRTAIVHALELLPAGAVLLIDFESVRHASLTALREVLSVFRERTWRVRRGQSVVCRIDPARHELVESLEHVASNENIVVPAVGPDGSWRTYGDLTLAESATLEVVRAVNGLTAMELADQLALMPNAARNRLKRLYELGLLRREERLRPHGGREFIYVSVIGLWDNRQAVVPALGKEVEETK